MPDNEQVLDPDDFSMGEENFTSMDVKDGNLQGPSPQTPQSEDDNEEDVKEGLLTAAIAATHSAIDALERPAVKEDKGDPEDAEFENMTSRSLYFKMFNMSMDDIDELIDGLDAQKANTNMETEQSDLLDGFIRQAKDVKNARKFMDAKNLNAREKIAYGALGNKLKLNNDEIQRLAKYTMQLNQMSGSFHGDSEDEALFYKNIVDNLNYMNNHGMQGMLAKSLKQFEDPKKGQKIQKLAAKYMKKHSKEYNYSDQLKEMRLSGIKPEAENMKAEQPRPDAEKPKPEESQAEQSQADSKKEPQKDEQAKTDGKLKKEDSNQKEEKPEEQKKEEQKQVQKNATVGVAGAAAVGTLAEIEALKKQLAEKDVEINKLKHPEKLKNPSQAPEAATKKPEQHNAAGTKNTVEKVTTEKKYQWQPVYDKVTGKWIGKDERYADLEWHYNGLNKLSRQLKEFKPRKGETTEQSLIRFADEKGYQHIESHSMTAAGKPNSIFMMWISKNPPYAVKIQTGNRSMMQARNQVKMEAKTYWNGMQTIKPELKSSGQKKKMRISQEISNQNGLSM